MKFFLRTFWRDLRGSPRFAILYGISLTLGLLAFGLLTSVKDSVNQDLAQRSRAIHTADLSVQSRMAISASHLQKIDSLLALKGIKHRRAERKSFFSMVRLGENSRLIEVHAISSTYPLVGTIKLAANSEGADPASLDSHALKLGDDVWVAPELLTQSGARIGDPLILGKKSYVISHTIVDDVAMSFGAVAMAPRLYVDLSSVQETGLIQFGSTVREAYFYEFFDLPVESEYLDTVKSDILKALQDSSISVRTHSESGEGTTRLYQYLNDYLGLVALTALFLAGLALAFLVRSYIQEKLPDLAIMNALGLLRRHAAGLYVGQILVLASLSALVAWVISALALPWFFTLLAPFLPFKLQAEASLASFAICLAYGLIASLLASAPPIHAALRMKPAQILLGEAATQLTLKGSWLWYLPTALFIWGSAVLVSKSFLVGTWFGLGMVVAIGVFAGGGWLLLRFLRQFFASKSFSLAFAARTLVRYPTISLLAIVALGLSFVLLTLVPHLKTAIADEFLVTSEGRPDFFLFDIQDEQVEDLRNLLAGQGLNLDYLSPLVRARMTAINGEILRTDSAVETMETREDERSEGSRNRGYNLTFRDQPFASETIISGPSFLEMGEKLKQENYLSIERRFADRLRVGLGDQLTFDIGGVEVSGRILNIREVKWVSFQPNFFIVFPSGILDDAPKTWIAGVLGVPEQQRDQVQMALVESFPNVSVLDVKNVSQKLSGLIDAMSQVLEVVALMAMLSGFMLLFILVNFQLQRRKWEYTLLRALGMRSSSVLGTIAFETMALLLMGLALGSLVSIGIANALSKVIFERWTQPDWSMLASLLAVAFVGGMAFSLFAALRIQRNKPKEILEAT